MVILITLACSQAETFSTSLSNHVGLGVIFAEGRGTRALPRRHIEFREDTGNKEILQYGGWNTARIREPQNIIE